MLLIKSSQKLLNNNNNNFQDTLDDDDICIVSDYDEQEDPEITLRINWEGNIRRISIKAVRNKVFCVLMYLL